MAIANTRRAQSRRLLKADLTGLLYVLPFLAGFLMLRVYPMGYSIWLMFQKWDLITPAQFAGLANFRRLAADPKFVLSLTNTAFYTFLGVPIHLTVALLLALALNTDIRGQPFYRTVFYLPSITPAVASAVIWLQMFHQEFGIINTFLANFGVPPIKWLFDPDLAKPAFILMGCWSVGPQVVIFLAGLQGIPEVMYEAAVIDGAGRWAKFSQITVPLLSPVIFFNLVMGVIGSFQVFTSAFIMTSGGPQNATLFSVLYIYQDAFQNFRMGYAALMAWVLALIILFFTFIQFRVSNRWVYYEAA
ncbi:MAG: carbohydrate ABC transporter permease [Anaerolineae bacterium]